MALTSEATVCNTFSDRQVTGWLEELDESQRRDERVLFGLAVALWIIGASCYVGVALSAIHHDGAATTAFGIFGTAAVGWGIGLVSSAKKRRTRRRQRNRQVTQRRQNPPPAAAA
jgi:hypothetical protein